MALFGFSCLNRNAYGDDSNGFPNAGPVAVSELGRLPRLVKNQQYAQVVTTSGYAQEPERDSLQSRHILKGVFSFPSL